MSCSCIGYEQAVVLECIMPRSKKKYTKKELDYFETLLVEKRAKLVEELGYLENSNKFSENLRGDLSADGASDFNSLETNFDLAQRESSYLVYLEDALDRIKLGTYGMCKSCDDLIPKARLEAVPTASKCVACKENSKVKERASIEKAQIKAALARSR